MKQPQEGGDEAPLERAADNDAMLFHQNPQESTEATLVEHPVFQWCPRCYIRHDNSPRVVGMCMETEADRLRSYQAYMQQTAAATAVDQHSGVPPVVPVRVPGNTAHVCYWRAGTSTCLMKFSSADELQLHQSQALVAYQRRFAELLEANPRYRHIRATSPLVWLDAWARLLRETAAAAPHY